MGLSKKLSPIKQEKIRGYLPNPLNPRSKKPAYPILFKTSAALSRVFSSFAKQKRNTLLSLAL